MHLNVADFHRQFALLLDSHITWWLAGAPMNININCTTLDLNQTTMVIWVTTRQCSDENQRWCTDDGDASMYAQLEMLADASPDTENL